MSQPNSTPAPASFLSGVIEGFYGQPWVQTERLQLFQWMEAWGLNTYFYCPKDDWKQRAIWRESYNPAELSTLEEIIRACRQHGLRFIYALSPGLDIRYSNPADTQRLIERFEQLMSIGCDHFALLFDDIPDRLDPSDLARWSSLADAQAAVANRVQQEVRARRPESWFLFCPTPYCGRMASRHLGGKGYLEQLGQSLDPSIDILWTGPEIISREITREHLDELTRQIRRPPILWDNLHANDYDGRRFFAGPYCGRPLEIRSAVRGILTNPNCEFALNYVAFRSLALYLNARESWEPRAAYAQALEEWRGAFETCRGDFPLEDLTFLLDCFYLPYEDGQQAREFFEALRDLLSRPPSSWGAQAAAVRRQAARLRDICMSLTELRNRPLFYALNRRVWELREEMDLIEKFIGFKSGALDPEAAFGSDFHLPETYRGSFVARLQQLLKPLPGGEIVAAASGKQHCL